MLTNLKLRMASGAFAPEAAFRHCAGKKARSSKILDLSWTWAATLALALGLLITALPVFADGSPASRKQIEDGITSWLQAIADGEAPVAKAAAPDVTALAEDAGAGPDKAVTYVCLPTCSATDARMLSMAGPGQGAVNIQQVLMQLVVPEGATTLEFGIFDGNTGGTWDLGDPVQPIFTLKADPTGDGSGTMVLGTWSGSVMPDNAWYDIVLPVDAAAQAPSGNYIYTLEGSLPSPAGSAWSNFKVRVASGSLSAPATVFPVAIGYTAPFFGQAEGFIIYPNAGAGDLVTTTYDGYWDFYLDVFNVTDTFEFWGGDADRGKADGTDLDTDDLNTPATNGDGSPFVPPWAVGTVARPEGVAFVLASDGCTSEASLTSCPADDRGNSPFHLRTPSIRYDLYLPDGQSFPNDNPSGQLEWERFLINTDPVFDPSVADYNTPSLPVGVYHLRPQGVDLANLNGFKFFNDWLGVCPDGTVCYEILRPYKVGDTVFFDLDGNGSQDPGEPGLEGVIVELVNSRGDVLGTKTTDASGSYSFGTETGDYEVRVAAANFEAGGALEGMVVTTSGVNPTAEGDVLADTVVNDNVLTYDFGYAGSGRISGIVWLDLDFSESQEPGEPGLYFVTVSLLDEDFNEVATTTTDANGYYEFTGLLFNVAYTVVVDDTSLPAGVDPTYDLDGADTPHEAVVSLSSDQPEVDNADFGYVGNGSIGDYVWLDTNGDGNQDGDEFGIEGVTLQLININGDVIATTFTDADGYYQFYGLPAENYTVQVDTSTLPAGLAPTYDLDGIETPNQAEAVLNSESPSTDEVDFGYAPGGRIAGVVWLDRDGSEAQDGGEPGIYNVTVNLIDSNGDLVASTVTDANGAYEFTGLSRNATYTVMVDDTSLPDGLDPTYDRDGAATAHEAVVTLTPAQSEVTDADFGYQGNGAIGDYVWLDRNGDGNQDGDEPGLEGVTLQLFNSNGDLLGTTATDSDGYYQFTGLVPDVYTVVVVTSSLPAGLVPSYDYDGIATANTADVSLNSESPTNDEVDFGYTGNGRIAGVVWFDRDGSEAQDGGEPGFGNVTVELLDSNGAVVATTTTAPDGSYEFTGLVYDSYTVRVDAGTLPAGLDPTYDRDGAGTPNEAVVTLSTGQPEVTDADFGYQGNGSIGDTVWLDRNGDGNQDGDEPGLENVTLELVDGNGDVVDTTVTDADGFYQFTGLVAGTYTVQVVTATLPSGLVPTYDLDGIATPHQATVTLNSESPTTEDVDFGYGGNGQLSGTVWQDNNANGTQDAGEPALSGVTVTLTNGNGDVVGTTVTDANGYYEFTGLVEDSYTATVDNSTLPAGSVPTYDLDGVATPDVATTTVGAGESKGQVDFGYRGSSALGDTVWQDTNGNGVQDAGEPGLANVTVTLTDGNGDVVGTTTTDGNGGYSFTGLAAGTYTVTVDASTLPAGSVATYDYDGTGTANTAEVTLGGGETNNDVDFGYRGSSALGDLVWYDANGNGVVDGGEAGISGVTVTLLDGNGDAIASTVTAGDGTYGFGNLAAGSYSVAVDATTLPPGLGPTYDYDGVGTPNSAAVTLAGGEVNNGLDFGYVALDPHTAAIGDLVWNDANNNGTVDAGELGIGGVTVTLLDGNGDAIATTTTAGDGSYGFSGLAAGTYTVVIDAGTLPAGYVPTYDADGTGTAHTATTTLAPAEVNNTIDFGYREEGGENPPEDDYCAVKADKDTYGQYTGGHSVWMPGIAEDLVFEPAGVFTQGDGTATLTGTLHSVANPANGFEVSVQLSGYTTVAPAGSPKKELKSSSYAQNGGPIDPATWWYYTDYSGTLTGIGDWEGAVVEIEITGPAFQVGVGANGKNANFGASSWFLWQVTSQPDSGSHLQSSGQGDFNLDLLDRSQCLENHCAVKADADSYGTGSGGHSLWLPGVATDLVFDPTPGTFTQNADGTATLTGTAYSAGNPANGFEVSVQLTGFTTVPAAGSPKKELKSSSYEENGGPIDTSTWWYYTSYSGTLTGVGGWSGAVIAIQITGPAFQVGVGANGKNGNFGASAWFTWQVTSQPTSGAHLQSSGQGDFNLDLLDSSQCQPGGGWCPRSPGYWKTHTENWPVSSLVIGGVTYNSAQLLSFLDYGGPDASLKLARQVVTTLLNLLSGSETSIQPVLDQADDFLAAHAPGSNPGGSAKTQANALKDELEGYNADNCSGSGDPGTGGGDPGNGGGGGDPEPPPPVVICPRSTGYWKTHTEVWPVSSLVLGNVQYNASQLLGFLSYGGSDAATKLARQLTGAKLNVLSGADASIQSVIDSADAFLASNPPGSKPKGSAKNQAEALKDTLDAYNTQECTGQDPGTTGGSFSAEITMDNMDSTGVEITGTWKYSRSSQGYYGQNYIHDDHKSQGHKSVRFTPEIPHTGTYEVFARWTSHSKRATNVPIDIVHANGTARVVVNQKRNGGEWVSLGTYTFDAGTEGSVVIRNNGANGYVVADAVRFSHP